MEQPGITCLAQRHNGDNIFMRFWSMLQQNIIDLKGSLDFKQADIIH